MKELTKTGFYCVAPDQRGYGKTAFRNKVEKNQNKFSIINLTKDIFILLKRLKIENIHIIGHDFGAYVASYFSLIYPKMVASIVLMSMPFAGPPKSMKIPYSLEVINKNLGKLKPKRKHYQVYFSKLSTYKSLKNPKQGLYDFLKNYCLTY